ncbi:MAG: ribonuclease III [Clostridia bacterium]|nr:ribonuclease III [Clostridia bacterium]
MTEDSELLEFEQKLGYSFKNKESLKIALTHKSYAHEHGTLDKGLYNERIEYLGDAILEHIISDVLYAAVPILNEGNMTKKRAEIVCEKSLSDAFSAIDGDKYIYVGKCDLSSGNKKQVAIIADAFEAVLGAVYLDSSYEVARDLALRLLDKQINDALSGKTDIVDYKTLFQELMQQNGKVEIKYVITKEEGPDHDKTFYTDVLVNGKVQGSGVRKKQERSRAGSCTYGL